MLLNSSFMTIKGLYTPAPIWTNFDVFLTTIIIAMIIIFFFARYAKKKQEQDGKRLPVFFISSGNFYNITIINFFNWWCRFILEFPCNYDRCQQTSYTFDGGLKIPPELIALTLALTLYTATFIAENVRAGIQGIGKGQKEAAASIGLTPSQVLKLVIMPQALRIIIPPTTNQYLNLTKNSSLAAAIAYPDLVLVFAGTAMMQTGRAIEIVGITMATYLTISLGISLLMNWYNKRIAIQEK